MLLFTIYLALGIGLYLRFSKKWYESQADILVRFGQEQLGSATLASTERNIYFTRREQEIQNEIRILTSNDTLMAAAAIIAGPSSPPEERLEILFYLKEHLDASAMKNSDIINVIFGFPDPHAAREVLAVVIEQYQIHHGSVYFDSSELDLTRSKMNAAHLEYASALEALTVFEAESRLYDANQIAVAAERRDNQQLQLNALISEYEYTRQRRDGIVAALEKMPKSVLYSIREIRNSTRSDFMARLAELQVQKEALLTRYTEDSQAVQNIQREIDTFTKLMDEQPVRLISDRETRRNETWLTLNNTLLSLTPEVEAQKVRIDTMAGQIREMDEELAKAAANKSAHALLTRDMELKKEIYDRFYQNYTEAIGRQEAQTNSITNASVVEMPSLNPEPIKPDKKRIIALGIGMLLVGNAFILGVRIFADNTLSSPEQAEKTLGLPVVGVFGSLSDAGLQDADAGDESETRPRPSPETASYEVQRKNFRQLYTRVVPPEGNASILFTSSQDGPHKAVLAENFAAFARDCQQRNPAIVVYRPDNSLPAGDPGDAPVRRIRGIDEYERVDNVDLARERAFTEELKARYDLVVFSYAPLQETPLLIALADQPNWVLYDVRAEKTNRYLASNSTETLREFGFAKIGVVLTDRKFHIPSFLYRFL
jgi:uncharacterized protein involved in exopolysaccharide biosynthesis